MMSRFVRTLYTVRQRKKTSLHASDLRLFETTTDNSDLMTYLPVLGLELMAELKDLSIGLK